MAKKRTKTEDQYIALAREQWHKEGEVEIDDNAKVSLSEDQSSIRGAYVQAWVWVDNPDAEG